MLSIKYSSFFLLLVLLLSFIASSSNTFAVLGEEDEGLVMEDADENGNQQEQQNIVIGDDADDKDSNQIVNKALVLVHQYLVTDIPAEKEQLTFRYIVMNAGDVDAQNIKFTLPDFPKPESSDLDENGVEIGKLYDIVEGSSQVSVDLLTPGQKHSVDFTIIPKKPFSFTSKMSAGKVEYRYGSSDPPSEKIGFVSSMGSFEIISSKKYSKLKSADPIKWAPLAIATFGSIFMPFSIWFTLYNKAEKVISFSTKKNQ